MNRQVVALAVVALLGTACSGTDDDAETSSATSQAATTPTSTRPPTTTPTVTTPTVTTPTLPPVTTVPPESSDFVRAVLAPARSVAPAWTFEADVLSQITVGDDWVAVAADKAGQRHDVVLDLGSGTELWAKPASTSAIFGGYGPLPPVVIGDTFVHLEPIPDSDYITMVGVDVRTGDVVWRLDRSAYITSQPNECDNGNVCGSAFWDEFGGRQTYEINLASGAIVSSMAGGEDLDGSVEMERDDLSDRFVRTAPDGTELWSIDIDSAFGRDVETSLGWSTDLDEDEGVFVAYVPSAANDFAIDAVIALDYPTGVVRWTREGRSINCWESFDAGDGDVWCAHTGRVDVEEIDGGSRIVGYTEVTTQVEVFDPATGDTIGTLAVEPTPGWDGTGDYRPPARRLWQLEGGIAADSSEGLSAIDVETGETVSLPDGQIGWCDSPRDADAEPGDDRFEGYVPCVIGDETRTPVDEPVLPASVIAAAGKVVGDHVVIVRDNRVRAYTSINDT